MNASKRGRPSKLSDRERAEIGRRLANGERTTDLAKEFSVSKGLVSKLFSKRTPSVQKLARSLADAELALAELPIYEQVAARSLADQLKELGLTAFQIASTNGKTAQIMAEKAHRAAQALPQDPSVEDLRPVAACIETGNKASTLLVSLMNNNREIAKPDQVTLEELLGRSKEEGLAESIRKARLRVAAGNDPFYEVHLDTGIRRADRYASRDALGTEPQED